MTRDPHAGDTPDLSPYRFPAPVSPPAGHTPDSAASGATQSSDRASDPRAGVSRPAERPTAGSAGKPAAGTTEKPTAGTGEPAGRPKVHRFRADVQGLRAVAVLSVLVFHAGMPWVHGGYVGVDVFFVISGYLITGLLIRELSRTGRISLTDFYARRARRILPAALVVLVLTLAAGLLILPVSGWTELGTAGFWSALSVVNWLFARQSTDYFAQDEAASPLQHYWSLAVEEQYYVVWPLLVLVAVLGVRALLRRRRPAPEDEAGATGMALTARATTGLGERSVARRVAVVAALVSVLSFAHALHYSYADPGPAYFVTTTRAWELGVGALLAALVILLPPLPVLLQTVLGWSGLAAIGAAVLLIDDSTVFPGVAALAPVLGSAAIILVGVHDDGRAPLPVARLLSVRPMTWIGDLSYSLYLVHWPLIAYLLWYREGDLTLLDGLLVMAVSVLLAWALRRLVEQPVLHAAVLAPRRRALSGGAAGMALAACVAGALIVAGSIAAVPRQPDAPVAGAAAVTEAPKAAGESGKSGESSPPVPSLEERLAEVDVAALVPQPAEAKEDLAPVYADDCNLEYPESEPRGCSYGPADAEKTVMIVGDSHAAQWTTALIRLAEEGRFRLFTETKGNCPVTTGTPVRDGAPFAECVAWNDALPAQVEKADPDLLLVTGYTHELEGGEDVVGPMAAGMERLGKGVPHRAVILDNPSPGLSVPSCVERHADDLIECAVDRRQAIEDSAYDELEAAARKDEWETVDLTDEICPDDRCAPAIGGALVYLDNNHLTATYVRTLAPTLGDRIDDLFGTGTSPASPSRRDGRTG